MPKLSRRTFLAGAPLAVGMAGGALLSSHSLARSQPLVSAKLAGMSPEAFDRLDARLNGFIDSGRRPGIVALVARHGKIVHHKAYGWANVAAGKPMTTDTIMRQHSMTKPLTCAAMLMLYEEGRFQLGDPVDKYIPEFADLRVFAGRDRAGEIILAQPKRKPTIQDLFRHTAGFNYGNFGDEGLRQSWQKQNPISLGQAEFVKALAAYPLEGEPGEKWIYSIAHDVLGRMIELFSGMSFAEFFQSRIFNPLDMSSSFIGVPPERFRPRLSLLYGRSRAADGTYPVLHDPVAEKDDGYFGAAFGGSGMWSTARDYNQFAQMLLNRGVLDGERLLSPATVDFMVRNHLPPGVKVDPYPGQAFGLGMQVLEDQALYGHLGSPGLYGWGGSAGTFYLSDPKEQMTALWMTQAMPHDHPARFDFFDMAYQAILD